MKLLHRINLLGREIQVRSNTTPEVVQEIEAYVNRKVADVSASVPTADQQLVTILTLLNITESYLALLKESPQGNGATRKALARISSKIEMALGEVSTRRVNI